MKFTKSPVHERMTTSKRMQKAKWGRQSSSPPNKRQKGKVVCWLCCVRGKQTMGTDNILLQEVH
jgi:hypothetical protein